MKNFIIKSNRALAAEKRLMILCAAVAFAASAMAQAASDSKTVDCGSSVTITATPAAGYHFVQWEDDATAPATRTITNIKAAATYKAIFAANDVNFGTDVTISPANPEPGQSITLTATPADDCQEFVRWSDGETVNPRSITYDGTVPFTAEYQTKTFNVNVTTATGDATQGTVVITQP